MVRYVEPEIIFWTTNLWKRNLRRNWEFKLLSYNQFDLNAHGHDITERSFTIVNFKFTWRVKRS